MPATTDKELEMLEEIIEAGREALQNVCGLLDRVGEDKLNLALDACEALQEVRAKRLYKEEYDTFEEYCRVTVGISSSMARRCGTWLKVVKGLESVTNSSICHEINEGQARELAKLDSPEEQAEVLEEIADEGKRPTAAAIRDKVEDRRAAEELRGLSGPEKVRRIEERQQQARLDRSRQVNRSVLAATRKHLNVALTEGAKFDAGAEDEASEAEEILKKGVAALRKAQGHFEDLAELLGVSSEKAA